MPILVPALPAPGAPVAGSRGAVVQLGDLSITQGQVVDGVRWHLEPIVGWDDLPESSGEATNRAGDDGAWLSSAYLGPRILQINGHLIGRDWTAMARASASVIGAVPIRTTDALTVAAADETPMTAQVRMHGKPLVDPDGYDRKFSLSLIAPDPRRYSVDTEWASTGLPLTTGGLSVPFSVPFSIPATIAAGVVSVVNEGNLDSPQVMTVTGPCPPCSITHLGSGRRLAVPDAVPAGRTLVLNSADHSALLDGTASRVVTGSWFRLDPGVNELAFSASSYDAAALLTISHRSAWR